MGKFSLAKLGVALSFTCFALTYASAVMAQTGPPTVFLSPDVTHTRANRGNNLSASQLDHADCVEGDSLSFPVSIALFAGYKFEVWAGSSCDLTSNRLSANGACWKVVDLVPSAGFPYPIVVSVPNLLYGRTLASVGTSPDAGTEPGIASVVDHADDPGACIERSVSGSPAIIEAFFMLIDPSTAVAVATSVWAATYKLTGPPPPDHLSATGGPGDLQLGFSYQQLPADTTLNGFQFFCDPPLGVTDAGPVACGESSQLVPGSLPPSLDGYSCGSAGAPATSGTARGLVGGREYNVAVAAVDTYDNVGVLSPLGCAVTLQGSDPLAGSAISGDAGASASTDATSRACSFSPPRSSSGFAGLFALAAGACSIRRRRSRGL